VLRSLDALDRSDIAILVIDATLGATGQDQRLAERISAAGCPSLVVTQQMGTVPVDERDAVLATVGEKLAFLGDAPVMKTTATSARACTAFSGSLHRGRRLRQTGAHGALNRAIRDLQIKQPHRPARFATPCRAPRSRRPSLSSSPDDCPRRTLRYVERSLRERFALRLLPASSSRSD